jgi:hypothetical protein
VDVYRNVDLAATLTSHFFSATFFFLSRIEAGERRS